ncbi:MAG: hypothetical protein IPJ94_17755 [Chloroflexi bacterium]|nr:hypothetical protein [Chloroflexota bacterium]
MPIQLTTCLTCHCKETAVSALPNRRKIDEIHYLKNHQDSGCFCDFNIIVQPVGKGYATSLTSTNATSTNDEYYLPYPAQSSLRVSRVTGHGDGRHAVDFGTAGSAEQKSSRIGDA